MRRYSVIVHEEPVEDGGGFWAEVEELPGCFASGDTLDELEKDVREAIESHVAALRAVGKPVPAGRFSADGGLRRWEIEVEVA
ncbi:MAG TPA: type II toxin-antitoxin system HicB family antitoxin [Dehalococcoidia bacterium]|jgi:predicted RNase H-like HicB family nuclease|nr:type II toxin-antitoxin system HicB family antitoxin [Dehalococcoidia bacterium]